MNDSALEMLKRKAKEKEFEKKAEVAKREQVERERMEQVHLTGAIYIEPQALREPTVEKFRIF
jgi:hypothetical protein